MDKELNLQEILALQASGMELDHTKLSSAEFVDLLWDWFEMGRTYERNADSWWKIMKLEFENLAHKMKWEKLSQKLKMIDSGGSSDR